MKKILAIGHSFVLAQNRDVFRSLHLQQKADVTVLAPRFFHGDLRDIDMEAEPVGSSLRVIPIDCYFTRKIHLFSYNIFQIEALLRTESFDAVYLWEEPYIVSGFTLAHIFHKYKIPYFFYSCQNIYKKYPWPFSFFEAKAQHHAAGVFACGHGVQEVLKVKNVETAPIIPFFVSLERFKPLTQSQRKERLQEMGFSGSFTVGFMGRLVEEKGITLFLNVAEKVLQKYSCNIIVIGSGPLEGFVSEWMASRSNCKLLKLKHDEVPHVLSTFDVLLCPSQTRPHWKEQFGRMLVEAFASGVVVLGSNSGEIPHVVGDAGKILSEKNIEEWVSAVEDILNSVDSQAIYVQRGLQKAKQYAVDAVADDLYRDMSQILQWK